MSTMDMVLPLVRVNVDRLGKPMAHRMRPQSVATMPTQLMLGPLRQRVSFAWPQRLGVTSPAR